MHEAVKKLKLRDANNSNLPFDIEEITKFYQAKFNKPNVSQSMPELETVKISCEEVKRAIQTLKTEEQQMLKE